MQTLMLAALLFEDICSIACSPFISSSALLDWRSVMWLLDALSYEISWFLEEDAVHEGYAILSHTWEQGEVTFQDIKSLEGARLKPGFAKIELCCKQALEDDLKFVWVDTCCIDKSSSAELSEAINSMFRWYQKSNVCYVYLPDISYDCDGNVSPDRLRKCRYWSRGWTLQELIAPLRVKFYCNGWRFIGTRRNLRDALEKITKMPLATDGDILMPSRYSAARIMSWASQRTTSRPEDSAYSLLGVFDVNMPLLYGEGERKAFLRLQAEIIRSSGDLSLLLWRRSRYTRVRGVLADSVARFDKCQGVVKCSLYKPDPRHPSELILAPFPQLRVKLPVVSEHQIALVNFKSSWKGSGPMGLNLSGVKFSPPSELDSEQEYVADIESLVPLVSGYTLINHGGEVQNSGPLFRRILLTDLRNFSHRSSGYMKESVQIEMDSWCVTNLIRSVNTDNRNAMWIQETAGQWQAALEVVSGRRIAFTFGIKPDHYVMLAFQRGGDYPLRSCTFCRMIQSDRSLDNLDLELLNEDGWAWLDPLNNAERPFSRWNLSLGDLGYLRITTLMIAGGLWSFRLGHLEEHRDGLSVSTESVNRVKWPGPKLQE